MLIFPFFILHILGWLETCFFTCPVENMRECIHEKKTASNFFLKFKKKKEITQNMYSTPLQKKLFESGSKLKRLPLFSTVFFSSCAMD